MPSSGSTSRSTFMKEYCGSAFTIAARAAAFAAATAARRAGSSLPFTSAVSARAPSAASATIATSTVSRRCSIGSMSMRAVLRPAGAGAQRPIGVSRRVPMPISRSVLSHSSKPPTVFSDSGWRESTTPLPMR